MYHQDGYDDPLEHVMVPFKTYENKIRIRVYGFDDLETCYTSCDILYGRSVRDWG